MAPDTKVSRATMRHRDILAILALATVAKCVPILSRNLSASTRPFDIGLLLHADDYDHLPKPMAIVFPTSAELAALNLESDDEFDVEADGEDEDEDDAVEIKRMPSKYYRRRFQNRFNGPRQGGMNAGGGGGGGGYPGYGFGPGPNMGNMGGGGIGRSGMGSGSMGGGNGGGGYGPGNGNGDDDGPSDSGPMPTRFGSHRNRRPWGPGASSGSPDSMMMRRGGPTGRYGPSNGGDTDYPNSGFSGGGNGGYGNPLLPNTGISDGFDLSSEVGSDRPSMGKALRPRIASPSVSMGRVPLPAASGTSPGGPPNQRPKAGNVLCCRPSGNRMGNNGGGGSGGGDGPFTGGCGPMGCGGGMAGGNGGGGGMGPQRPYNFMGGPGMGGPPAMMGKGGGMGGWNGPMGSNGGGGGGGDGDDGMGDNGGGGMMSGGNGMMGGGGGGMMGGGGDGPPTGAVGIHMSNNGYSYAGYIERQVRSTTIMMYTLVGCVPCQRAKHLLAVHYADVKSHFLELVGDEDWQRQLQVDLQHITGALTFPYIFVCGNYIGGSSDLFGLHQSGQLRRMVNSCSRQKVAAKAA
uniref:Glutaredoxin domain-containing protein n=1 Tax=Panagrellus redivivus TaxID=6233 RepID=A0A7E4UYA3_PANRE